jgi:hypothetical protein
VLDLRSGVEGWPRMGDYVDILYRKENMVRILGRGFVERYVNLQCNDKQIQAFELKVGEKEATRYVELEPNTDYTFTWALSECQSARCPKSDIEQ